MRGRDIRRYAYDWQGLWLINTHNGLKGKIPPINIEDYPSIKEHLDQYWAHIKERTDQGVTPYNLRNCAYLDDFNQPKIVWGEISDRSKFALDSNGQFVPEATSFLMVGKHLEFLCCLLNSNIIEWYFSLIGTTTGVGTTRWKKYTLECIPAPLPEDDEHWRHLLHKMDTDMHGTAVIVEQIDNEICYLFGLTEKETDFLKGATHNFDR